MPRELEISGGRNASSEGLRLDVGACYKSSTIKGVGMSFTPIMATKVELELGRRAQTAGKLRGQRDRNGNDNGKMRPFLFADPGTRACPLSQASRCLSSVIHPGGRHRTSIQQKSVFVGTMNKGRPCLCRKGILSLLPVAVSEAACLKSEVLN